MLQAVPAALQSAAAAARPALPQPSAVDRSSMNALALIETELLEDSEAALAAEDDAGAGRAAAASLAASNALRIPELLKQLSSVLGSAGEMHRRSEEKTAKVRPQLGRIHVGWTAALVVPPLLTPYCRSPSCARR